jgi:uncharacterized protein YndB with AHSA1/START domain
MSEQRGFRVEVVIHAPRDVVWRALTDPDEPRRWFGWDYEGLGDEIRYIFVDHATQLPPARIEMGGAQTIELVEDGPRTIVRVVQPGPLADAAWDELYEEIVQGWHAFFQQLRHYLERHPGEERRTLYLEGTASAPTALAAVDELAPGQAWYAGRHQRVTATERYGGGLVVVLAANGLDSDESGRVQVTLTTHGLDDARFAAARREWAARWTALARDANVSP